MEVRQEAGSSDDVDSLFDETASDECANEDPPQLVSTPLATYTAPPIPGLYFDPSVLIPEELAESVWAEATRRYFNQPDVNQIMLFERASESDAGVGNSNIRLPAFLLDLLETLSVVLKPVVPKDIHELLFLPSANRRARQAILNLYYPGEGIMPHVDLLKRFGDGIIGVSFHGGCSMHFRRVMEGDDITGGYGGISDRRDIQSDEGEPHSVYLPPGSVIVLTGEARYNWTHGIERRNFDMVQREGEPGEIDCLPRGTRLSITFRWLLPGAEIVGEDI